MEYFFDYAKESFIDEIYEVEKECFIEGIREKKETFIERIKYFSDGFIVCRNMQDGKIIGYLCSEIWNNIFPPYKYSDFALNHSIVERHNNNGNLLYISSMGILKSQRSKGIGKFLFNNSINLILKNNKQIELLILIVNENWKSAEKIYSNAGFLKTFELESFFVGENNLRYSGFIYEKKLNSCIKRFSDILY